MLEDEISFKAPNLVTPKQKGKAKMKAPLFEADVRRSQHLKLIKKGFKSSSYKDRNCLGCSATSPTISPKVITSLGASFCGIDPNELTNAKLNAKPAKKKKKDVTKEKAASEPVDVSEEEASQSAVSRAPNDADQNPKSADSSSSDGAVDPSNSLCRVCF